MMVNLEGTVGLSVEGLDVECSEESFLLERKSSVSAKAGVTGKEVVPSTWAPNLQLQLRL